MLVARLSGAMDGGGQSVHGRIYSGLATSMPNSCKNQYANLAKICLCYQVIMVNRFSSSNVLVKQARR